MSFHVPNQYRIRDGLVGSDDGYGNNGAFDVPYVVRHKGGKRRFTFSVIASDGEGWEHISVAHPIYVPGWDVMCHMKALFWDDEDAVIQIHPPASEYVNNHPNCLHLWRPIGISLPLPPSLLVGLT